MDCVNSLPWDGTGWPNVMCNQPPCGQLKPSGASVGFAKSLLKEMMGLFPSQVISTGADGEAAVAAVLPSGRKYPWQRWRWLRRLLRAAKGSTLMQPCDI